MQPKADIEQAIAERRARLAHLPKRTRVVIYGGAALLALLVIWFLYVQIGDWWHNRQYAKQTAATDTRAVQAESAGDSKVGGADEIHKELERLKDEQTKLDQRINDLQQQLDTAHQASATTRTIYVDKMRAPVRVRAAGDGVDDASLRADSERARQAIDRNRTAPDVARKP